jgi:glycosyltransferase involved in cell wall biosynthesis
MPRALHVSWLFPPHNSIGAKRAYRFARQLPALGLNATVLCGREPPARFRDPSPWSVPEGVTVEPDYDAAWITAAANRIDAAKTSSAPQRQASGSDKPSWIARVTGRELNVAHDLLPTETIAVHLPHARRAAVRLARRDAVSVVWTTSYPYSAHFVGIHVKRALGIPFVADLRDPWTLNFVHERKLPPTRAIERAMERSVFAHADRIVVTTESLADAYRAMYPAIANRFVTIRNGFEPLDLPARRVGERPRRLVPVGHVYSERTLAPVLHALARIGARDVVIENLGRLSDTDRSLAHALGLDDIVHAREPLPYLEGLASLRAAHALLLPAWGTDRGALLLPGKLYDYLLAGAPIVAIGRNAELASILAHTRTGVLIDPDDANGLDSALRDALAGTLPFDPDSAAIASYSAPEATRRLAQLFDAIAPRRDVG